MSTISTAVVPFQFNSSELRTIQKDDKTWFIAKDVCDILALTHTTKALSSLDDDELTVLMVQSGSQLRKMNAVSESGLYALIFKSRKPQAKDFRKWVTSEVLPQLRKSGAYSQQKKERELRFHGKRFLATLSGGGLKLKEIDQDCHIVSMEDLGRRIADPGTFMSKGDELHDSPELLKEVALAALARLSLGPSDAWTLLYDKERGIFNKK